MEPRRQVKQFPLGKFCVVLNVHVVVDLYPSESLDPRRRLCSGMETGIGKVKDRENVQERDRPL